MSLGEPASQESYKVKELLTEDKERTNPGALPTSELEVLLGGFQWLAGGRQDERRGSRARWGLDLGRWLTRDLNRDKVCKEISPGGCSRVVVEWLARLSERKAGHREVYINTMQQQPCGCRGGESCQVYAVIRATHPPSLPRTWGRWAFPEL